MDNTIGKRIMKNRKALGLTQEQLAEQLGVTAQAVSKWENDLSCPDISVLPQLADIFGISIDALLGRQTEPVYTGEVITQHKDEHEEADHKGFEMTWDSGKKDAIGFGIFVVFSGVLYFLAQLLSWNLSFWDILWPSALAFFGLWGLYPKFSFFRLGCSVIGLYFLAENIFCFSLQLDKGFLFAFLIILFGGALIVDGVKKTKKPKFSVSYTDKHGNKHRGEVTNHYECDDDTFSYSASFGSAVQSILLEQLSYGEISANFGEYTVDLSQLKTVSADCHMDVSCNFGELIVLIPGHLNVKLDNSASFGEIRIEGQPEQSTTGTIYVSASTSFGEILFKYT